MSLSYADDLAYLNDHADVVELKGTGNSRIAVVPGFQGRVMTSTLDAETGSSFGWVNRKFISAGEHSDVFNNYGGEDRFWMGPEAGQFALWFKDGAPFDLAHWHTPPGFNAGTFEVTSQGEESIAMATSFELTNYAGNTFDCAVKRTISVINEDDSAEFLSATVPTDVSMVAFESKNVLANVGDTGWDEQTGMPSIWILGMFKPLQRGFIIVPFIAGDDGRLGPRATTDYFSTLPEDRCKLYDDHLLFKCDGAFRSKIGISPARAKQVLGSYDPDAKVLTIAQYNLPAAAGKLPYVNSLWEMQEFPFGGDVVNAYNDGEPEPGAGQMGPFYELETSSPAARLDAGDSITHIHRTYHFAGEFDALNSISLRVLGVDLSEIEQMA